MITLDTDSARRSKNCACGRTTINTFLFNVTKVTATTPTTNHVPPLIVWSHSSHGTEPASTPYSVTDTYALRTHSALSNNDKIIKIQYNNNYIKTLNYNNTFLYNQNIVIRF